MIIKSAIFFLRIFDNICDAYDWISGLFKKFQSKKAYTSESVESSKPSYLYR